MLILLSWILICSCMFFCIDFLSEYFERVDTSLVTFSYSLLNFTHFSWMEFLSFFEEVCFIFLLFTITHFKISNAQNIDKEVTEDFTDVSLTVAHLFSCFFFCFLISYRWIENVIRDFVQVQIKLISVIFNINLFHSTGNISRYWLSILF